MCVNWRKKERASQGEQQGKEMGKMEPHLWHCGPVRDEGPRDSMDGGSGEASRKIMPEKLQSHRFKRVNEPQTRKAPKDRSAKL